MSPLDFILEPLGYEFMVRALVTTSIAALVCALLSCWLVLIGWSLMGDAVSHAVLPGVVLAYIVSAPFALGAVVFGVLAVGLHCPLTEGWHLATHVVGGLVVAAVLRRLTLSS